LGQLVPNIEEYILPIVIFIIFVSFLPPVIEFWKEKRKKEDTSNQA
jgi:hypothetical protein